jgi:Zn-dependent protease
MSLAGPLSNLLVATILAIILRVSPVTPSGIWPALSFLLVLQVSAVFFNLIPLPPFDGYSVIEPFLSPVIREQVDQFRGAAIWIVLLAFWYILCFKSILGSVRAFSSVLSGLEPGCTGFDRFRFWQL